MKKLILRNWLSPGDVVMLTAAVRDLHRCYPGQFATDVRTHCPELWRHNPYLTNLSEEDPAAEVLDCRYPLIQQCNQRPYHCLHGFIEFLNEALGLRIVPTEFKGDIHLSDQEKVWFSQVRELTDEETPFWIVAAGGKYDVTVKWWARERYQRVVDHFRGRIQFVQVGAPDDYHPRLEGVVDLRGRTDLRQLVRLVYHSQGVLSPVTCLMHLAAAVEVKDGGPQHRPCVVVAGGREPPHWEAYPHHQFLHAVGALPCCQQGGCWRSRTFPLGDGDERDQPENLCLNRSGDLPRCLDLISAEDVIRRIEWYFEGGTLAYLDSDQARGGRRAVCATSENPYDQAPLTVRNARLRSEQFIRTLPDYPGGHRGRGVVICGGGPRHFLNAWVCIRMLRRTGCSLPIQLWHLGPEELDDAMQALVKPWDVECVDATRLLEKHPARILQGWQLKSYALLHSPYREALLLDADNVAVANPELLFHSAPFRTTGAIFWPDYGRLEASRPIWSLCGVDYRDEPEFESGQVILDKATCWKPLLLCRWYNDHSDFFYRHIHGDKETFHLAFLKLNQPFAMPARPIHSLDHTMCQHDFEGRRLFQHRNQAKWRFSGNPVIPDFWLEEECLACIEDLRRRWKRNWSEADSSSAAPRAVLPTPPLRPDRPIRIRACLICRSGREPGCDQTLRNLAATDWDEEPFLVRPNPVGGPSSLDDADPTLPTWRTLEQALRGTEDYVLLLEDAMEFNRFLRHNLQAWSLLRRGSLTLAGLSDQHFKRWAFDAVNHAAMVDPGSISGMPAFLLSRDTVAYLIRHWNEMSSRADLRIPRLAARLGRPLYFHAPSLARPAPPSVALIQEDRTTVDFDPFWKAGNGS
jgi:ADP-heptose:LPS heptosyltransferase